MLEVDNLNTKILKKISFHLKDKENLLILGSNGAGKSTLAKVLCGIIYSENIKLFTKNLNQLKNQERASYINYIPPKLDIFDEYIYLREYLELSKLDSNMSIDDVLELFGLVDIQHNYSKNLSSGEQQLALLASSILHNAKITILDEPTANLDPIKTQKIYKFLSSNILQTKIIITHDLNLAYKLDYKILYIEDGKIIFFDKNKIFFEDKNLKKLFGSSLKRVDEYFVVNLGESD